MSFDDFAEAHGRSYDAGSDEYVMRRALYEEGEGGGERDLDPQTSRADRGGRLFLFPRPGPFWGPVPAPRGLSRNDPARRAGLGDGVGTSVGWMVRG